MIFLAIGIVTLFLTAFMLIYYGYLFKNTDHDVSFFIGVGIISIVMNLFTNMSAGAAVLSVVYLVVAAAGLGVGFAISLDGSIAFYGSIGTWFKNTFTDTATLGWKLLSFILSPVGIVLYFVFYRSKHDLAVVCGKAGIWGLFLTLLILWAVFGLIGGINSISAGEEVAVALLGL